MSDEQNNDQVVELQAAPEFQNVELQPVQEQPVVQVFVDQQAVPKEVEEPINSNLEKNKELLLNLVNKISDSISDQKIGIDDVLSICITGMKFIEKLPQIAGEDKKKLVINAIEIVCGKAGLDNSILSVIPSFIDIVISLDKKKIYIKEQITNCCNLI
jgi:hypothetical protein